MINTEQTAKWTGDFGEGYLKRNFLSQKELNELYMKNVGYTRTDLNDRFLNGLPINNVLEVGCNIGIQLVNLWKLGFKNLYGIDIYPKALEFAKSVTSEAEGDIYTIKSSAQDILFKDNSFDLVMTDGLLIHISPNDIDKVLEEIHRVSKKHIYCYEYYNDVHREVDYHDQKNLMWKGNFAEMFLKKFPDLKLIKEMKLTHRNNKMCIDHVFLLEKIKL